MGEGRGEGHDPHRHFLFALFSLPALAAWPEKPIKVLIGYAPGGSTDVVARLISPKLSEKLGQPIVIENKPGGAGDFAAELMLQAPADGYTLMMSTVALHAINPGLYKTQRFHPINDFTPIALVCSSSRNRNQRQRMLLACRPLGALTRS